MNDSTESLQQLLQLQLNALGASVQAAEQSRLRWSELWCSGLREGVQRYLAQEREATLRVHRDSQGWWPVQHDLWNLADEGVQCLNAMADAMAADQAAFIDSCQQTLAAWQASGARMIEGTDSVSPWLEFMRQVAEGLHRPEPAAPAEQQAPARMRAAA